MPGIRNILIANRGEVALRVMRTARDLGISTVAVYSNADVDSPHVAFADQAVYLGEAAPGSSYLNIEAIIRAARESGADAVHPGYGFLAENEDFAEACTNAGLIFVGPSAQAINAMGDKANAKIIMRNAGIPCVPGYEAEDQNTDVLYEAASRIGYPVMIKATAGGGGRGMRIVRSPSEFRTAFESAKSEARHAFGSDRVILERVIENPRHIEIQVVADRHGNAIHLGERDCSVQRRHQKVIEEAPGIGISESLRERMGGAAVTAAKAIGYEGVGTLEFLLDARGEFYFMEMNTRLQVEHPVTEAVTGLDLVAMQLRVAMGQPLHVRQKDVKLTGHSIEVRLCAEDEHQDFMPQSGTVTKWTAPAGVRVETALESGSEISPYYDSMFAKIISYGKDRDEARSKLVRALNETVVFGIKTNKALLTRCLQHPHFAEGGVTTGFFEQCRDQIFRQPCQAPSSTLAIAAVILCADGAEKTGLVRRQPATIHLHDNYSGTKTALSVSWLDANRYAVAVHGETVVARIESMTGGQIRYSINGLSRRGSFQNSGDAIHIQLNGETFSFSDTTYEASTAANKEGASDGRVRAAMSGRVAAVFVCPGDRVQQGAPLLTLEAMKMEHLHSSPADAVVKAVTVTVADQVTTGKILVELVGANETIDQK